MVDTISFDDLPDVPAPSAATGRQPLRLTVTPTLPPGGEEPAGTEGSAAYDAARAKWLATVERAKPRQPVVEATPAADTISFNDLPHREVSGEEAFGRSAAAGATFGTAPVLAGVAAAGGERPAGRPTWAGLVRPFVGLGNMISEGFTGEGEGMKAYRQGRDESQAALEAGREQHPIVSFGGELLGGALVPLPGIGAPATLAARLGRGAVAGGAGGAAYGAGSALSEGKDLGDVAKAAGYSGLVGAGVGGTLGAALGPRIRPTNTPGQRAARTAETIGAPIPRGLASDNPVINATTSKVRSVPIVGSRISSAVDKTQAAAGRRIEQIAAGAHGVAPDRALAGATLRPALQNVINDNNGKIDLAYQTLRHVVDPNAVSPVGRTAAALKGILRERIAARMAKPESGLQDVIKLTNNGASFNGLQRARADVGKIIGLAESNPNPGFNVGDFKRLYAAMSADMEGTVRANARGVTPDMAAQILREANRVADTLIDRNKGVQRVLNVRADERLVGSLVTSAQEKTGNLRLLRELRASMHPDDFHQIAGTMLGELGHNNSTGQFSLNQFVTKWDKVSDGAKAALFSPQHLSNINDIAGLGTHIKGALRESNTSHTAGVLILFDLARDAALMGGAAVAGTLSGANTVGAVMATPGIIFAHWLSKPATASSMSSWVRAYRNMIDNRTPLRLSAFQIATRNLSNNLGISLEDIANRPARPASSDISTPNPPAAKSQDRVPALAR